MKVYFFLFLLLFSFSAFAKINFEQGILNDLVSFNHENLDFSENKSGLNASHKVVLGGNFTNNYNSNERLKKYNEAIALGNFLSWLEYKNFSLKTSLRLESFNNNINDNQNNLNQLQRKTNIFQKQGVFLQEFVLGFDQKNYSLWAGKFNLNFGTAWKWDRNIWAYSVAQEYKQEEKLGFGGIYRMGDIKKTGRYNFTLSSFNNDRKNFDNSLFSSRKSDTKSDAKPGDTKSFSSYLTLNVASTTTASS